MTKIKIESADRVGPDKFRVVGKSETGTKIWANVSFDRVQPLLEKLIANDQPEFEVSQYEIQSVYQPSETSYII